MTETSVDLVPFLNVPVAAGSCCIVKCASLASLTFN